MNFLVDVGFGDCLFYVEDSIYDDVGLDIFVFFCRCNVLLGIVLVYRLGGL